MSICPKLIEKGNPLKAKDQAGHLLIVRLNNHAAIAAAFGPAAVADAMNHMLGAARRHLGGVRVERIERGEILIWAKPSLMTGVGTATLVDTLCVVLGAEPFRYGEEEILLSVSAGHAAAGDRIAALPGRTLAEEARGVLGASTLPVQMAGRAQDWAALYAHDMAAAARLVGQMRRGALFFTWRPICRAADHGTILYHEAALRRVGDMGEQMDCADGYGALQRLGLAHLIDRLLLSDVLDELESDPAACLSVAISSQSLSLNLHGEGAGWTDLFARLKRNRRLARRLVVEISDNCGMSCFRDALAFVRALREMGVRIAIGRFGSGRASIGQLRAIAPDVVKLDSPFLHAAYQCERNRVRVGQLLELARGICSTVIVDGVESPWHMRLVMEEGAEWIAGTHLGRPSLRRGWMDRSYSDSVASLAAFGGILGAQGGAAVPAGAC